MSTMIPPRPRQFSLIKRTINPTRFNLRTLLLSALKRILIYLFYIILEVLTVKQYCFIREQYIFHPFSLPRASTFDF